MTMTLDAGVAAGQEAVSLLEVQLENKKAMDIASFLNGVRLNPGDHLGDV